MIAQAAEANNAIPRRREFLIAVFEILIDMIGGPCGIT